jgi:aryl-alcohol dehydrogenase-like predicted oxidoreductase
MIYRPFGNTGIHVSVVGFGAGHIGLPGHSFQGIQSLLGTVLDRGINLIDTARSYGESEARIGNFLGPRRKEVILSTKVGYMYHDKPDWGYEATMGTIEESLQRLRTDYIDIVHLHSCDRYHLEQGDCILALEHAREQGKIRVIAYSGENEALQFALDSGRFGSIQCSVNIFDQQGIRKYLPVASEKGMGIIAKRPLGNAVWRYANRPEGHGHVLYYDRYNEMNINDYGFSMAELALRFSAFAPFVSTVIIGTSDPGHLDENLKIVQQGALPDEIIRDLQLKFEKISSSLNGLI